MARHSTQAAARIADFETVAPVRPIEEAARLSGGLAAGDRPHIDWRPIAEKPAAAGDGFGLALASLAVVLIVVLLVAVTLVI
jgi:hypothetical protein